MNNVLSISLWSELCFSYQLNTQWKKNIWKDSTEIFLKIRNEWEFVGLFFLHFGKTIINSIFKKKCLAKTKQMFPVSMEKEIPV